MDINESLKGDLWLAYKAGYMAGEFHTDGFVTPDDSVIERSFEPWFQEWLKGPSVRVPCNCKSDYCPGYVTVWRTARGHHQ